MKNLNFKRILSILLTLCLTLTLLPVSAFAAEDGAVEPACTHTHDADCGYIDGAACTHVCGEGCGVTLALNYGDNAFVTSGADSTIAGYFFADDDTKHVGLSGSTPIIRDNEASGFYYIYTVDIFNYDPTNPPTLYDMASGGAGTLIDAAYDTSYSTSNGFLRMTFGSASNNLAIRAKNNMEASGAFGNGSFVLTEDYPHVYLVGGKEHNTAQAKSSLNPSAIFYVTSTNDGKIKLTAIKANTGALSMTYWSPSSGDKVINGNATNVPLSEMPALIPNGTDGAKVNGLKVFTVTSDDSFAAGAAMWFYARSDFGNGTESVFSSDPGNTATGLAHENANYSIPGAATVPYAGTTFDLSGITSLFAFGSATYTLETSGNPTGTGSIGADGKTLTVTKAGTFTIGLIKAETSTHTAGTMVTATLTVNKGTAPAAPTGLDKSDAITIGGADGKITGLANNTAYEYKKDGGSYTAATSNGSGEITGLAAGSYVLRLAETDLYNAGADSAAVVIGQPAPTYGISLDKTGTQTFTAADYGYSAQTALTVTVSNTGNQATGALTVALSGTNSSSFTLNKMSIDSLNNGMGVLFTVTPNTGLAAGTYTATVTVSGGANITSRSFTVSFTVNPKALTNAMITVNGTQTYTGNQITPSITVTDGVTALVSGTDYESVTYGANINAGTSAGSVTITGKGNYSGTAAKTFDISKATYGGNKTASVTVRAGQITTNATLELPALPGDASYAVSGTVGGTTVALIDNHSISGTTLTYSTASQGDGDTATITIAVNGGTNYENYNVVVTITVTAKTPVTISGVNVTSKTYDGTTAALDGAVTVEGDLVDASTLVYLYESTDGGGYSNANAPTDAGAYKLTVSVPGSNTTHAGSAECTFTISKATITITANNKSAIVGDPAPMSYTYTVSGLVGSETLTTNPTLTCTPNMNATGIYPIVLSGAIAPDSGKNYNVIVYNNGALTVSALPQEATPNAGIDYSAEKLTGLTASTSYSINSGANVSADASGNIDIAASWLGTTITIIKKGDGTTITDSNTQSLPIPARAPTPSPVGGAGQITGVTSAMEYKLSTASAWTPIGGTTVTGLSAGTYYVRIKATAGVFAGASASVTVTAGGSSGGNSGGSGNNGSGSGGSSSTPAPGTSAPEQQTPGMTVDGKAVDAGEVKTEGGTTTLTVNQDTMNEAIETAKDNVTITVPAEQGTAVVELVMKNMEDMSSKDVTLTVSSGNVRYDLPASAVDTSAVLSALGADSSDGVSISITVTTDVSPAVQAAIANAMAANGGEVIIPPIEFKVTASYGGETYEINTFSSYVSRSVQITEEQAKKVTTAVLIEPDGTVRHIPTYVYQENGKWYYAVINSLTNSAYALISNEIAFTDVKGRWYEGTANEIGSRMILSGVSDGIFAGEGEITRAEFVAIVIRALGLPENGGTVFSDVPASSQYAKAVGKAYEYGLISGVGNDKFAPDRAITRQEAMLVLYRAAKVAGLTGKTGSIDSFSDASDVSAWALEAVQWNVGSGIVSGSDGKLKPAFNITRAETAVLVLKILQGAGLIDVRTPLTSQAAKVAFEVTQPRKEPDPIQAPDDNEEETPDPDGDGNDGDDDDSQLDGSDGDAQAQMTPQQAIQTLNNLLAYCGTVTRG